MVRIFVFHHDLRLEDNTTLLRAIQDGDDGPGPVLPVFIFPPEQIDPAKNAYFSNAAVQFMCECLEDLDKRLKSLGSRLFMFRGSTEEVLARLMEAVPIEGVYCNQDESSYAKARDAKVAKLCKERGVPLVQEEDYGLVGIQAGRLMPDGRPYLVLSQYYARLLKEDNVRTVATYKLQKGDFVGGSSKIGKKLKDVPGMLQSAEELHGLYARNAGVRTHGGREEGLGVLRRLREHRRYGEERDLPAIEGTTRASAHLRFGTISIREMYWAAVGAFGGQRDNPLVRELVFRDFYYKIYTWRPELQRGVAFRDAMDKRIPWKRPKDNQEAWQAWLQGTTGFPLADAGMRQLAGEGWVHNRVRMLVASVATRYLMFDWRDCAKAFYKGLVDADPFSNTAGWQWAAGIGVDSAPYFRAPFNPFLQSKRFDKDAEYIKRWVPELAEVPAAHIHRWGEAKIRALYPHVAYPAPLVDQAETSKRSLEIWMRAAKVA